MISKSSLVLTAVFGASTLMVFGVLTDKPPVPMEGDPIPELDAAEAEFSDVREALNSDLRRVHLTTLLGDPEERREAITAWMERNGEAMRQQEIRMQAIEKLYDRYNLVKDPTPLERLTARAPETAADPGSPQGRLWAMRCETAALRETHAGDPEKLRDALSAWDDAHGEEYRRLTVETAPVESRSAVPPARRPRVDSLQPGASPEDIRLAALKDRISSIHTDNPCPADASATPEELDEWRDRVETLTAPVEEEMRVLSQPLFDRHMQQLREYIHEQLR